MTWVLDWSLSHSHFASSERLFSDKINCALNVIGSPATLATDYFNRGLEGAKGVCE